MGATPTTWKSDNSSQARNADVAANRVQPPAVIQPAAWRPADDSIRQRKNCHGQQSACGDHVHDGPFAVWIQMIRDGARRQQLRECQADELWEDHPAPPEGYRAEEQRPAGPSHQPPNKRVSTPRRRLTISESTVCRRHRGTVLYRCRLLCVAISRRPLSADLCSGCTRESSDPWAVNRSQ